MPIYEYQCKACGHKLEAFQKISEAPLQDCPECHKSQLEKLISAAGFQLKGSGWYATDYSGKKDAKKDKKESAEGDTKTPAKKDEKKSDTSST